MLGYICVGRRDPEGRRMSVCVDVCARDGIVTRCVICVGEMTAADGLRL